MSADSACDTVIINCSSGVGSAHAACMKGDAAGHPGCSQERDDTCWMNDAEDSADTLGDVGSSRPKHTSPESSKECRRGGAVASKRSVASMGTLDGAADAPPAPCVLGRVGGPASELEDTG
jgi:hypothetical protein